MIAYTMIACMILIATSEGDLQDLVSRVQNASERVGLLTNSLKTKVMTSGKNKISVKICVNGEYLEQVESFVYLGSVFTDDGSCIYVGRSKDVGRGPFSNAISVVSLEK